MENAMTYTEEQINFLKSFDFMRLGQAVKHGQWQSAAMIIRRMDAEAKKTGMKAFENNFVGIRQCIQRKQVQEAQQILAVVINKRAKYLNEIANINKTGTWNHG